MKIFGYRLIKEKNVSEQMNLLARVHELEEEIKELILENHSLQKEIPLIDTRIGDPSPTDKEAYDTYVAEVAALHKNILEPKLKHMISNAHALISATDNIRDYDLILKGVIYAFWEIISWGDLMVNKQLANQIDNPSSPDETLLEDNKK